MSLIKRILSRISGKPSFDPERMANDLFSGKAEKRRIKEDRETDRIILEVLQNRGVQNLMREVGITEDHIRDVHRRLMLHGDKNMAIRAINNAGLLRWYYLNGGKDKILSESQALQLFTLAKNGRL